jgi:hypothetical protein
MDRLLLESEDGLLCGTFGLLHVLYAGQWALPGSSTSIQKLATKNTLEKTGYQTTTKIEQPQLFATTALFTTHVYMVCNNTQVSLPKLRF